MTKTTAKKLSLRMSKKSRYVALKQRLAEDDPDMLFIGKSVEDTTYDEALIGTVQKPCGATVACYDFEKCIRCLMVTGMSYEDALDWMDFNVTGAYVGETGPVFFHRLPDDV